MESILRELRKLAQDRHSLNQTVLWRFLQCQKLQVCSALSGKAIEQCSRWHRGRALLPPRRILTAHQLMAPECGVVLPRLDEIPREHRFLADDQETIALAGILVESDIGTHREGNFHQAPGLFIKRPCRVAPVPQFIEGLPHLRVVFPEVLFRLW